MTQTGRADHTERSTLAGTGARAAALQLTEDTTHAFFVFDRLDGLTVDTLHHAADELSDLLRDRWPSCRLDRIERHAP